MLNGGWDVSFNLKVGNSKPIFQILYGFASIASVLSLL